jgi:hypothetical protein
MFLVTTISPIDERWEDRDQVQYAVAGRKSDSSQARTSDSGDYPHIREHGWMVDTFAAAVDLRIQLALVSGVVATVREVSSQQPVY